MYVYIYIYTYVCMYVYIYIYIYIYIAEVIPHSITLGELKRRFKKADASQRVIDYLRYDGTRLTCLASATAALLYYIYIYIYIYICMYT